MELVPLSTTNLPLGEAIFFMKTINMTIIDTDGEFEYRHYRILSIFFFFFSFGSELLEAINTESVIFNSGFLEKEYSETISEEKANFQFSKCGPELNTGM